MALWAFRGGRLLNEKEFRSHLALATRLEHVGVLLGAGSSLCAGGKLVKQIWNDFGRQCTASYQWFREKGFITEHEHLNPELVNLEEKLDHINTAELEWLRQNPNGLNLRRLRRHRNNLYRVVLRAATLNKSLWEHSGSPTFDDALSNHRKLLARLVGNRQPGQPAPWLFTTNYDLAVEWACESLGLHLINGFTGLHNRTFTPHNFDLGFRNVQARGEARFGVYNCYLVKLHGSISWLPTDTQSVREASSDYVGKLIEEFLEGKRDWPGIIIYPSAAKYVQTTGFIYGELIRKFSEFLSNTQSCLVVNGYSFRDDHLNRILSSALQNPTLHLILYVPELRVDNPETHNPVPSVPDNPFLQTLLNMQAPQVTIVGPGEDAHFESLVQHLPEPALIDDHSERAQKLLKALERAISTGIAIDRLETDEDAAEEDNPGGAE